MNPSQKKVLVIGSEGFVGKNLVTGLMAGGFTLWGADLIDIKPAGYGYSRIGRLQPEFEQLFVTQQFDYCINAAGSGSVPVSIASPDRDFEANVADTFKLLNAIRLHNTGCRYIHISSAAVYGNPAELPVKETALPAPVSPYGYHKWISEITCGEFTNLYKIPVAILRPFSAYGPGLRKQLIWDLYQKFKAGGTVTLHGTGEETRDFIYIEDMVNAVAGIIQADAFTGEIFNLGSGTATTIKEVADIFNTISGTGKEIVFEQTPDMGNPLHWEADISKLTSLGFRPRFTLEQGLRQTLQWMKENG